MNEKLKQLLSQIERKGLHNDAHTDDRSKKYLNITRDTGEFLWMLVKTTNTKYILEVGTSNGYSTLWLADALPASGKVITIEHAANKIHEAQQHFEQAQLTHKIEQHHTDAQAYLKQLNHEFDFIFLDADRQDYLYVVEELIQSIRPGGVIVCDNARSHFDELKPFMDYFKSRKDFNSCLIEVGKGEFIAHKNKYTLTA